MPITAACTEARRSQRMVGLIDRASTGSKASGQSHALVGLLKQSCLADLLPSRSIRSGLLDEVAFCALLDVEGSL